MRNNSKIILDTRGLNSLTSSLKVLVVEDNNTKYRNIFKLLEKCGITNVDRKKLLVV